MPAKESTKTIGTILTVPGDDDFKPGPLTIAELKRLDDLEEVVGKGLSNFIETGAALAEILHDGLYRKEYKSFDEYLYERWGLGKSHAYRLINGSKVAMVLDCKDSLRPTHEAQVRPMTDLENDQIPKVWMVAIKNADGGAITEQIVKAAVREVTGKKESKPKIRKLSWKAVAKQAGVLLARTRVVSIILKQNHSVEEAMEHMRRIEPFLELLANADDGK